MISKKTALLFILVLTILGGILRFYGNTKNPVSLNVDEVSTGYNAYSILKTGKDEYGYAHPLTFKSLGDYKPPLYIYLTTLPIAVFGLNEFSVRFLSAFLGMLSIPLFYLFFKELTGEKKYALLGSVLLTISPWHIYFSRFASESQVATFFLISGMYCLLRMFRGGIIWSVGAAILLVLSMYTYHSERLFVPLFMIALFFIKRKEIFQQKPKLIMLTILGGALVIPLAYSMFFGPDRTRAQMTFITSDIDFIRYIAVKPLAGGLLPFSGFFDSTFFMLIFHGMRKYLAYFQPSFLFYNGLGMTAQGTYGLGILYLFEAPFLIAGAITLIRRKFYNNSVIFWWVILGIIPAAITLNEQHPIRTMVILPMTILISAIGGVELWRILNNSLKGMMKFAVVGICTLFIIWNLGRVLLVFTVYFPNQKGEGLMEGTKQAVVYALSHKDNYREIVFDPVRGVEGPYTVSVPHAYYLFYGKYDPALYQEESKREGKDSYGFDKFTVRSIEWRTDRAREGTLFIGSPWSLPAQDIKEGEILQKIYLTNGKLALLVVSPEGNNK